MIIINSGIFIFALVSITNLFSSIQIWEDMVSIKRPFNKEVKIPKKDIIGFHHNVYSFNRRFSTKPNLRLFLSVFTEHKAYNLAIEDDSQIKYMDNMLKTRNRC